MRLLLDKNLSHRLCAMLEEHGWDARHAGDLELGEADDDVILSAAREDERVVVSSDTDFGGLPAAERASGPSVILTARLPAFERVSWRSCSSPRSTWRKRHSTLARSSQSAVPTCESDACRCDEARGTPGYSHHGTPGMARDTAVKRKPQVREMGRDGREPAETGASGLITRRAHVLNRAPRAVAASLSARFDPASAIL